MVSGRVSDDTVGHFVVCTKIINPCAAYLERTNRLEHLAFQKEARTRAVVKAFGPRSGVLTAMPSSRSAVIRMSLIPGSSSVSAKKIVQRGARLRLR